MERKGKDFLEAFIHLTLGCNHFLSTRSSFVQVEGRSGVMIISNGRQLLMEWFNHAPLHTV